MTPLTKSLKYEQGLASDLIRQWNTSFLTVHTNLTKSNTK